MSGHKMPSVKHTTQKVPDPQGTQHHSNVQKLIDRPQNPTTDGQRGSQNTANDGKGK